MALARSQPSPCYKARRWRAANLCSVRRVGVRRPAMCGCGQHSLAPSQIDAASLTLVSPCGSIDDLRPSIQSQLADAATQAPRVSEMRTPSRQDLGPSTQAPLAPTSSAAATKSCVAEAMPAGSGPALTRWLQGKFAAMRHLTLSRSHMLHVYQYTSSIPNLQGTRAGSATAHSSISFLHRSYRLYSRAEATPTSSTAVIGSRSSSRQTCALSHLAAACHF